MSIVAQYLRKALFFDKLGNLIQSILCPLAETVQNLFPCELLRVLVAKGSQGTVGELTMAGTLDVILVFDDTVQFIQQ